MTHKNNDPFGFNKAINYKTLDNPKVLNEVANMFGIEPITINAGDIIRGKKTELEKIIPNNNYNPNDSYKKAVNTLKRKIK
jgi:hypothetical protein